MSAPTYIGCVSTVGGGGAGPAFGVLGPVVATTGRDPVPLKGARQRAVLARLLIARGRVVPVDRLVGDLWVRPPAGAVAAIRTFVADLRRALEPGRAAREPARVLVTAPPGYLLRAEPDAVDAWRFEAAVASAARLLTAGRAAEALAELDEAQGLWRGPAYVECADQSWARSEINRLDELRLLAVERRGEALLALGRAADAVADLQAHADGQPLREDAWHLLGTALYRAGRQGEALAALRRAREGLVTELGVDPGPRLRRLEADILAQAPHLDPRPDPVRGAERRPFVGRSAELETLERAAEQRPFVGRSAELETLERAAQGVTGRGQPVLALVSGEAGAGKTALAEALTRRLAAGGWSTVWARSPEHEGAPTDWPWAQPPDPPASGLGTATEPGTATAAEPAIGTAAESGTAIEPATATSTGLGTGAEPGAPAGLGAPAGQGVAVGSGIDPALARFRLRRAAVARLAAMAGRAPVLLVVDDLHRADDDTLDLLAALPAEPARVLIVGTYRATEIGPELTAALARFARAEPVRVYLGGLAEAATGELAGAVARQELDAATAALIHRRSGGNPFFVRELARLFAAEGGAALERIPAGVRDVIRHRLARLPEPAQTVLRQAAVLGRDVDPDVLAELAGDPAALLDALDDALRAGLLTEEAGRPRFTHILVRDTLYDDLSALRRASWHAATAEAIERLRPDDVTALAHHFGRAANRATAPRAAHYARLAAQRAERQVNPREAARLWRQAIDAHDRAGGDVRARLAAVLGLGRSLAVTGHLEQSRRYRAEAMTTAEQLDDPGLTATVIAAFDVPAVWARNDDEQLSRRIVAAAERALAALPAERLEQRSRLLGTIALELRGSTAARGRRAAAEAEAIARTTGDPALLAFALDARFMQTFHRPGLAAERARIGAELVELAAAHELVTFEVLGRLVLLQSHCALGDFAAADAEAKAADRLAERYDLPVVAVFTGWYAGLRMAVDGHRAEAEAAYRAADNRLASSGMPGMSEGLLDLALLSLGRSSRTADPWARPLTLLSTGRRAEAVEALRALAEPPHDQLLEARLCLALRAAEALDDHATAERLRTRLRPAAAELAGAATGVLSFGPIADLIAHTPDAITAG